MHRIDNQSAVPILPTPSAVGIPGFFVNGDQRRGVLATKLDRDFFNALQEELLHVIEEAGLVADKSRYDQLLLAILIHIQRGLPAMPFLPLAGGTLTGPVYQHIWPTQAAELSHKAYVDGQDTAVVAHSDAQDVSYHNEAVGYANTRAIQEGDRAQNTAWAWDQAIWERVNWIDQTQGGMAVYGADALFVVPGAARLIHVWCTGGGGGGAGAHLANYAAGGGGAGGTAYGAFSVVPGQQFPITVGAPGQPGPPGGRGTNGGATQFGSWLGGSGGEAGAGSLDDNPAGGRGGIGFGTGLLLSGGDGSDGWDYRYRGTPGLGGDGGSSFWGGGGRTGAPGGAPARALGSGGGGAYTFTDPAVGGVGAGGLCLVTWNR